MRFYIRPMGGTERDWVEYTDGYQEHSNLPTIAEAIKQNQKKWASPMEYELRFVYEIGYAPLRK